MVYKYKGAKLGRVKIKIKIEYKPLYFLFINFKINMYLIISGNTFYIFIDYLF